MTGSDLNGGSNVERLRAKGITITVPHQAPAVEGACVCVVSTAIPGVEPRGGARTGAWDPGDPSRRDAR